MHRCSAVNVDIDSLYLYYRLHGLDESRATNAVWEKGVVRFAELFDEVDVKATFYVVSQDLERWPRARQICAQLASAGHEIGSHTDSHPYDLIHQDPSTIAAEVSRSRELLSEVRGAPVTGFRAPGYHMAPAVYDAIRAAGYSYSSSLFPSWPYHLAKWGVMASMRLRGKRSKAIVGDPKILVASRKPHFRRDVLELPVTVLPGIRFPFIGTSLIAFGHRGYSLAKPLLNRLDFVNLEFHGIDMCDLHEDGIDPALLKQPDLRVPLTDKRAIIKRTLSDLRERWGVATLEQLAPLLASGARN